MDKDIVAFIAYKLLDQNSYYIAWECAKHPGYAQALKLLVFCHAWDNHPEKGFKITLDLCGGNWLSHPSARKINLKFGFKYDDQKSVHDQAELLCKQRKCSLQGLEHLIFGKDEQGKMKAVVSKNKYKTIRDNFEKKYFKGKRVVYNMSCEVTKDHIIRLLVMIQASQMRGLTKKVEEMKKKRDEEGA